MTVQLKEVARLANADEVPFAVLVHRPGAATPTLFFQNADLVSVPLPGSVAERVLADDAGRHFDVDVCPSAEGWQLAIALGNELEAGNAIGLCTLTVDSNGYPHLGLTLMADRARHDRD